MRKIKATLPLAFVFFFGSSCANQYVKPANPDIKNNTITDTRAFIKTEKSPTVAAVSIVPALISAIAPVAIDRAIGFLGDLLKKAAQEEEITQTAVANDNFYIVRDQKLGFILQGEEKKLIIIHGTFGPQDQKNFKDEFWENCGEKNKQSAAELGLIEDPDFYFSGRFDYSPDGSSFRLKATRFQYRLPFGKRKTARRDIVLTIVFQTPYRESEKSEGSIFALGTLTFKNLTPPICLQQAQLDGKETKWLPILNFETDINQLKEGPVAPYTVVATITETRDANKYLQLVSEIFEGSKEEVTDIITDPINP